MKCVFALFLTVFLLSSPAMALQQEFDVGVSGGLNIARFYGDDADIPSYGQETVYGPRIGAFIAYKGFSTFDLQSGINFSSQGAAYLHDFNLRKDRISLSYLDFPLLAKIEFDIFGGIETFVMGGAFLSFMINGTQKTLEGSASATSGPGDWSKLGKMDSGVRLGIDAGRTGFMVGVRHSIGLGSVNTFFSVMNSVTSLLLGYEF